MSVEQRLRRVFADVFAIDPDTLKDDDSPLTIEAWDSIAHLNLVFALEGEFTIQFDAEEIPELISFGVVRQRLTRGETGDG